MTLDDLLILFGHYIFFHIENQHFLQVNFSAKIQEAWKIKNIWRVVFEFWITFNKSLCDVTSSHMPPLPMVGSAL